jgi:hypothetical protein
VLESALSFAFVFLALLYFGVQPLYAAVAASIAIATAPAVVLVAAQEIRAEGQVTERALNLTAMNSVIAFVSSTMLLAWLHHGTRRLTTVVLHPVYLLAGSALLGLLRASPPCCALAGPDERGHLVVSLGLIAVTVAAARVRAVGRAGATGTALSKTWPAPRPAVGTSAGSDNCSS